MKISNYSVENRLISFVDTANITGNENVDTFHFDFDSEWDVFSSKYFILVVDGKAYIDMLDSNNNVILRDIAYDNDNVTFGVYGISGSSKLSSNIVWLETIPSAFGQIKEVDGLPDKTVWELYTEEMLALLAQGQITLEQCQQALNDTQSARDLAEGYKNTAKGYMETTEGYKNDTNQLKTDTQGIVDNFNANVQQKTTDFNNNAISKTNAFNQNATDKTTAFNNNAVSKTGDYNDNATSKTNTFNQNAQDKLDAVTSAGTTAVGNVQDAEGIAITHIQTEGASYDARLDDLEAVTGTGTDTFSTSNTYEAGDVVVYDNKLYRCITAIETAGEWDDTKWEEINLRQEQDEQNERIQELKAQIELIESNYDKNTATKANKESIVDSLNGNVLYSTLNGKTHQETSNGNNKFPVTNQNFTISGLNFLAVDGSLFLNGGNSTEISYNNQNFKDNLSFTLPAGNYKCSKDYISYCRVYVRKYADNSQILNMESSDTLATFTLSDETMVYISFYVNANTNVGYRNSKIMIYQSDTDLEYEPYSAGYMSPSINYKMPIHNVSGNTQLYVSTKNLIDVPRNLTWKQTKNVKDSIHILHPGSYKMKCGKVLQGGQYTPRIRFGNHYYSLLSDTISDITVGNLESSMYVYSNGNSALDSAGITSGVEDFMIYPADVEGDSYIEYKGNMLTFPLSEGQKMYEGDYLADDGIHHVRKEKVFDGSETFASYPNGNTTDYYCYRINIADSRRSPNQAELDREKCNYLIQKSWYSVYSSKTNVQSFATSVDSAYRYFKVPFATVEAFKEWLTTQYSNNTPMILEYELAEEEIEAYTETQQIAWNNLKKIQTYKPITHIQTSSDDLAPDLKVTYLQNPLSSIEARLELLES